MISLRCGDQVILREAGSAGIDLFKPFRSGPAGERTLTAKQQVLSVLWCAIRVQNAWFSVRWRGLDGIFETPTAVIPLKDGNQYSVRLGHGHGKLRGVGVY